MQNISRIPNDNVKNKYLSVRDRAYGYFDK